MSHTQAMNSCFLDRRGCGDEFYMDAHFKAARWIDEILGAEFPTTASQDEDDTDEPAGH